MRIERLPRGWVLDWSRGEIVVGIMDRNAFARIVADDFARLDESAFANVYSSYWNQRTFSGRFFGFRIRRFVVSGWVT